jgi:hypothetical protein
LTLREIESDVKESGSRNRLFQKGKQKFDFALKRIVAQIVYTTFITATFTNFYTTITANTAKCVMR